MTLKIDRTGQVIVVSPRLIPKQVAAAFVAQHQDWITQKLTQYAQSTAHKNSNQVEIYGKLYDKTVADLPGHKLGILIKGTSVIYNTPEGKSPPATPHTNTWLAKYDTALERFLKASAQTYITKRTEQLAKKMQVSYGKLTLREQSSRWGSCSSAGNLNFNWRLVHAEPAIIDYVIVHELAHRVHMDHSQRFWRLVEQFDPDYRVHRGWLKRHGHSLS